MKNEELISKLGQINNSILEILKVADKPGQIGFYLGQLSQDISLLAGAIKQDLNKSIVVVEPEVVENHIADAGAED